jgi:hypothetical protein
MYGPNDAQDSRAISIGGRKDYRTGVDAGSAESYRQRHEIIVIVSSFHIYYCGCNIVH